MEVVELIQCRELTRKGEVGRQSHKELGVQGR